VASFAQGHISAPSLSSLTMPAPAPNLPDRSELQSPIQEDRAHRAFRFPVSAKSAGEGTSFRGNAMNGKGKRKGGAVGRVATNCIPFPTTTILGGTPPPSPTSSTTTTTSYSRSAASSTTSISTCSSTASLELKLASFPAPPSTPPHVLLRVRQAQSQPKPSPTSRARKLSGLPKSTMHKPKTTPPPIQARNLLTLAAALGKATAPRMSASVSVPPASTKRADVPRLVRRGLVDDRDGMERPGSPIPRSRGERRRSVVDESEHEDEDDAQQKKQKQKKKEDEDADLKSALAFEPPPYSAPPPPYSPTVSPPPVITAEPRVLPTPPVEEIRIHAPVPKAAYVPPQPQSSSSQPTTPRRAPTRVSASEIRVLLTLYRTVMVGLEKRYRAAEEATAKAHGEKVNGKEKAKARFPLVEDDDEMESQPFWVVDDTEEEEEEEQENVNDNEEEYIPRRRPPPTRAPPNSPVGSPPSSGVYVRPLPAARSIHQEPAPAQSPKNTADLDVQDALLAIRLRGFLKAQGVSEAELDVVFDEMEEDGEGEDDETMAAEIDRALAEMHAASASASAEKPNEGGSVVVEASPSPTEEGMHALPPPPRPRPVEKRPLRSSPSPPLELNKSASRNVISGGRTTSPSPPPSASYMIALLTMRHRYASRRSGSGSVAASKGYPIWRRSSALKSVAWVAPLDEDEEEGQSAMGMEMIQEEEDGEMDVDSVVELYAGMC
jgi:hypothetical protein